MTSLIIDNFRETRKVTIKLARAIPADLYDSAVAYEVLHINRGIAGWMHGVMKDGKGHYQETSDKQRLITYLRSSRIRILNYWKPIDSAPVTERGFLDWVLYITSHEVHHRARLIEHVKDQGVEIPFMPRSRPSVA